MFIVLLNVVVAAIAVGIAILLTLIAIILIIISLVRSHKAKKNNMKTAKAGLWIGVAMLVIPWIFVIWLLISVKISDEKNHKLNISREILASRVIDDDSDQLYDLFADDVIDSEGITEEEIENFITSCNITKDTSEDLERYTDFASPKENHMRYYTSEENGRKQTCFQYNMYNINDEGGSLCITGVDGDAEGEEYVGIYLIGYSGGGKLITIGQQPPKEH
ncbi:MAG: hypothetical protein K6E10_06675 [Eubacterium sp.]|nr:hypothetical protein [Eubacterium sp.]